MLPTKTGLQMYKFELSKICLAQYSVSNCVLASILIRLGSLYDDILFSKHSRCTNPYVCYDPDFKE